MMQRAWTLIGGLVLVGAFSGLTGCSSADEQEDTGTGGSSGTGGTGTATGGTGTATGGTSSATGGTSSATGGTTGTNTDPECKSIKSNMMCTVEGKSCPNLVCGLADSGSRMCNCATNWTCSACDFTNSWLKDPPNPIPACPSDAADKVPCLAAMTVCGPVGTEYCACAADPQDGALEWDCDSKPTSWP